MIRTPWPSRSAPHHWIACQIDGSPKASPAWIVKWAFSRWRYSKASRCRVGGKPASAPAMSKPTTPVVAVARSRARRSPSTGPGAAWRSAAGARRSACRPAARPSPSSKPVAAPPRRPRRGSARRRRAARGRSAPRRRRRRRRRGPRRTRARPGRSAVGGLHHRDGVVEGLQVALQRAGVGATRGTSGRAPRRRRPAARGRPRRRARRSSAGAARRRGGRAAGPWGRRLSSWSRDRDVGSVRPHPSSAAPWSSRLGRRACAPSPRSTSSPPPWARSSAAPSGSRSTQERVDAFADATGDHQWIHVDVERGPRTVRSAAPSRTATSRCR